MKTILIFSLLWLGLGHHAYAQEAVHYQLSITDGTQHSAQVRVQFPASKQENPILLLPNWRTGRYEILPLANGLRDVQARTLDGQPIAVEKVDKSSWQVQVPAGVPYTFSYTLYANELRLRTRHIDDSHAYLNASAVFVYSAEFRQNPIHLVLKVPNNWQSVSGLPSGPCAHCFEAANYDVLTDSPIETGIHQLYQTQIEGKKIELVIWGAGNYDGQSMLKDFVALVKTTNAVFTSAPYQRYVFIVHATDGISGATEHINSTVIQTDRWSFQPRQEYVKFLRTAAHEFFHTWNVKAYRPKELVPYDYQHENYTNLLWLSEGHTSYFENILTLRAGLQRPEDYWADLSRTLDAYFHTPGRFLQSANESSFNAWIQPDGDRHQNASVSFYPKGELIGLTMDLLLRKESAGRVGLQNVHQILWDNHRVDQGGFSEADVQAALQQVSGHSWQNFWDRYIIGTEELPVISLLSEAGLSWVADQTLADGLPYYWWGLQINEGSDHEFARVVSVEKDSPAWNAGLVTGDTLMAVNGFRISAQNFAQRSQSFAAKPMQVDFFRRDARQSTVLKAQAQAGASMRLEANPNATAKQMALRAQWLGQ